MPDLTQEMLDKLLRRLDPDRERAGEKYNSIQRKLIKLFQWRGCSFPEKHAQEVINRLAKRIAEGEEIGDLDKYVNVVTKYVLFETLRQQVKDHAAHEHLGQSLTAPPQDPAEAERQDECFKQCLQSMAPADRALVEQYFQGEKGIKIENRKRLAEQLNVTPNALRIRCLRIRERIKECFYDCVER